MTTTVESNGSKWAGQAPDPIEVLYDRLHNYPLDPSFEKYGNFIMPQGMGEWHFWGNFLTVSAVFSIKTTERDVIDTLIALIYDNQRRQDYRAARADMLDRDAKSRRRNDARSLGR